MIQLARGMLASPAPPVIDPTGLIGLFDIRLVYNLDTARATQPRPDGTNTPSPVPSAADPTALSIFAQEQLGLKLASDKVSVAVHVIDHVEKPSAN